jgi:hypothetical protein
MAPVAVAAIVAVVVLVTNVATGSAIVAIVWKLTLQWFL